MAAAERPRSEHDGENGSMSLSAETTATALTSAQAVCFAEVPTPRDYVYRPEHKGALTPLRVLTLQRDPLRLPNLFFVLEHPSEGVVLVDTGLHPDALTNLRQDYGLFLSRVFGRMRPCGPAFDRQLRELGIDPAEVELVLMTHLHVDHTSGMRLLPRARFVIGRQEWNAAVASRSFFQGFAAHHLPPREQVQFVDLAQDGQAYGPFEHTVDYFGDGSVRLIRTPGHTPGHQSILLQLGDGREVLLVGDAAYTIDSIEQERLPLFTASDRIYADTLSRLHAFKRTQAHVTMIPFHDPHAWKQL